MENECKVDKYYQNQNERFQNLETSESINNKINKLNQQEKRNNENCVYVNSSIYDNPDYYINFSIIPYLNGFENYSILKKNHNMKIPIKSLNNNEYIYVNNRQYYRILKRREKRKNLKELYNLNEIKRNNYIHESRHKHAMKRERGKGGRFLSKQEKEILKKENEINKEEENNNCNDTLSYKSSIAYINAIHDSKKMKIF